VKLKVPAPKISVTLHLKIHILSKRRWKFSPGWGRAVGSACTLELEDVADQGRLWPMRPGQGVLNSTDHSLHEMKCILVSDSHVRLGMRPLTRTPGRQYVPRQ
jgi:hypothetical protein